MPTWPSSSASARPTTCRNGALPARSTGRPPLRRPPDAVGTLLSLAGSGSVNVRSFKAGAPKGGPFTYGLTRRDDVLAVLRARAGEGLHTIVNETVDVDDGGVSGVALGGLVEFAPGDTPRSVERPGTVALGHDHALALLGTVYGFTPDLDERPANGSSSASTRSSPASARPIPSSGRPSGSTRSRSPPS